MEDKLVTLAILTYTKAQILKNVLENEGIETYIHNVNQIQPVVSSGVRLRIKESDLPRALKITESSTWLSESIVGEKTPKVDSKSNKISIPVDFSNSFHFSVSLIHLAESKDTWNEIKLAGIKDYFQKQYPGLEIHYDVVMNDNLLKGLDQYIKDNQIDIITLTSYKRNIFARLFNPSIARKMIFHSDTPLLVIYGRPN